MDPATDVSNQPPAGFPSLDATEARIIGCLIEKAAITPEVYPLTVNAIVSASNQKTSREPLMHLEMGAVAHALRVLEDRGLVKVAPSSQRVLRYEHRFDAAYGVTARQRAALCVMMLRGPQTLAEILTRTERLTDFPGLDDVRDTLDRLMQREPALAVRVPRGAGQREDRYMHLLSGPVDLDAMASALTRSVPARNDGLEARVAQLENEVAALRDEIAALRSSADAGDPA
ncbi:MAG: YceH family protein [Rhodanobacteraceae bacterium]